MSTCTDTLFPYTTLFRSGKINIFSFDSHEVIETLLFHAKPVFDLKFLASKNELIASSEDGTVSVWCLKTYKKIHHLDISNQTVRVIAIYPMESTITFGTKAIGRATCRERVGNKV